MMNNRPTILILLSKIPYPFSDGTRFKVFDNILIGLSEKYTVDILFITNEKLTSEAKQKLTTVSRSIIYFHLSPFNQFLNLIKAIFSKLPFQSFFFRSVKAQTYIKKNIMKYDAVYVHTIRLSSYVDQVTKAREKVIIDFNDALSLNYNEAKHRALFPWNIIYSIEEGRIFRYEQKLLATYSFFSIVSSYDKKYLLPISKKNISFTTVPHGINRALVGVKKIHNNSICNLVFLGNLKYPPNRDAVLYFIKQIWPTLHTAHPIWTVHIIGNGKELFDETIPGVVFDGFISNHGLALAAMDVFISPIRFGAGTPTKILEAMAVGLPIIGTRFSMRGIEGVDMVQSGIFLKEDALAQEWMQAIESIDAKEKRESIGRYNTIFISRGYTNESSRIIYQNIIASLVKTHDTLI